LPDVLHRDVARNARDIKDSLTKTTVCSRDALPGMEALTTDFKPRRTFKLLVGGDGIPLKEFLSKPVEHWAQD
jgi:hypothetical protein